MSYILTGESNPHFPLRALILAPALQSDLVLKITPAGAVEKVLRFMGTQHIDNVERPAEAEYEYSAQRRQVARFFVLEDSANGQSCVREYYDIEITEQSLEHELFAFIPRVITQNPTEGAGADV